MKTCNTCNENKDEAEFSSSKAKNGKVYVRKQCRACERARCRAYYADNIEQQRKRIKRYGLSVRHGLGDGGYDRLLEAQGGCCAICKTENPGEHVKYFSVDHDHNHCPGKFGCSECVRGLLCYSCNHGLGNFKDSIERLETAIEYLRVVHQS